MSIGQRERVVEGGGLNRRAFCIRSSKILRDHEMRVRKEYVRVSRGQIKPSDAIREVLPQKRRAASTPPN